MALVAGVKNILVRIWTWLERLVAEEAVYQGKLTAEKLAAEKLAKIKEQSAKSVKSAVREKIDEVKSDVKEKAKASLKKRAKDKRPVYSP